MKPATAATQSELSLEDLELALARLDRREADVALRGTSQPPGHLVGVRPGTNRSALWASRRDIERLPEGCDFAAMARASPDADEDLVDYLSKRWRHAPVLA